MNKQLLEPVQVLWPTQTLCYTRVLSLSSRSLFGLNCCKSNWLIRRAFTRELSKCLLKQVYDSSYVSLHGVQVLLKVGIMASTFFIIYTFLSQSSVVNFMNLGFLGTYISTCVCTHDI